LKYAKPHQFLAREAQDNIQLSIKDDGKGFNLISKGSVLKTLKEECRLWMAR
jgi:signal transduction histidine kinase